MAMVNEKKVSVVIVNWKSFDYTMKAIQSLDRHVKDGSFEVIVVDNNSLTDEHKERLKKRVCLCVNDSNLGFAIAANQGVQLATTPFVLLLNPDCQLTETGIEPLLKVMENQPEVGICGPMVVEPDGEVVRSCRRSLPGILSLLGSYTLFSSVYNQLVRSRYKQDESYQRSGLTACIQGSCFLVRRSEFQAMGGFDERIPLFLDDMDLCARYRKSGFQVYYCSDAVVIHEGGRSIEKMTNHTHTSLVNFMAHDVFFLKHRGLFHFMTHRVLLFVLAVFFLSLNLVLLPVLYLLIQKRSLHYLSKHFWMLVYSLTGCFSPRGYPPSWPKCLFSVIKRK
ncbi:MAG: hypothetical protein CSA81_01440 [Acidobacteria bacterium]|nr:MAG: hypothetical protein CSA81_01440 [Acidobacteriota bacterium]